VTLRIDALVAEIGSTTTLVNAFDGLHGDSPRFIGQGSAATSVAQGDVRLGLQAAIDDLKAALGAQELQYTDLFATSSAAGGLKMSVHGLVYDMTVRAAQAAALGAGAVVRQVTAGMLRESDLEALRELHPNLILLAGGTDYGERDTALYNARAIAALGMQDIPTLYAGNVQNQGEVRALFEQAGLEIAICDNVYPRLDDLNIEPARRHIQMLFERHIVKAPGMRHVYDMVTQPLMPTPGAVMEMARLMHGSLGNLAVIDIGGATTDVHSACEESEEIARIQTRPEPLYLRTVEGDLGLYINAAHLLDALGTDRLDRELGTDTRALMADWQPIPRTPEQEALGERLALEAGLTALRRHAGSIRSVFLPGGRQQIAEGKDLTQLQYLIATGGALTRLPGRERVMAQLRDMNAQRKWLYPKPGEAELLTDHHYIMASLGVLSRKHPQAAMALMQHSFLAQP